MKFSRTTILFISALALAGGVFVARTIIPQAPRMPQLTIRGNDISVEIAETPATQLQGLSGRPNLCSLCGMLFIYTEAQRRPFWMKDMLFPLDFVWIRDARIVDMTPNVPTPSGNAEPVTIIPPEPVTHILEVPAGTIASLGWQVGDRIELRR